MATVEEHRAVYRRAIEAISRGDAAALEQLLAPDVVDHNPMPDQSPGVEGFKQWMSAARASFPDLAGTIEDLVAEGDRIVGRVTWRGTQTGPFVGVGPTGKTVSFTAIHIVRLVDGRIAEWWGVADLLGALEQVGASVAAGLAAP